MKSWYHSWIAAIRIARRDAWRSKGRSLLVLSMIALPILGVSAADLTLRSAELSAEQQLERKFGAADATVRISGMGGEPIYQDPNADMYAPVGGYDGMSRPGRSEDMPAKLTEALPPGAQTVKDSTGTAKVRTRHGLMDTSMRELDTAGPLVKGIFTLDRGRMPRQAGEVAATNAFLEESGLYVGSSVTPRGTTTSYKIVGAYELPDDLKTSQLLAPPGTLLAPLDQALQAAGLREAGVEESYLVKVGGEGFTWNMVKAANAKGAVVLSRAVILDPPADSEVPLYQQQPKDSYTPGMATRATELAILATVVGLAMLEICLLAGPAFAVGARRSRRQLGLVGANGGDRSHIRAIVLSGGLVIGFAAAVVGITLGVLLTFLLQPVLEDQLGNRFGNFDVRPLELAGVAVLAVLTGLLAAIAPAITASRQTVLASLTGRRGVRRANRVLPVIGLVAVALGVAIALLGTVSGMGFAVVAGGSAIAELGIVALTPVLVGLFGRLGRWLPLSPRLALRDAVRNRGRTAPAVAAVLAAVAGTVAVATYQHSRDVQMRHEYVAQLPDGAGRVAVNEAGGYRDVPAVREALTRHLPVSVRADVERISVGRPGCEPYSSSSDKGCGRAEVLTPKEQRCPLWEGPKGLDAFTPEQARALRSDWRCKDTPHYADHDTVIADGKLLTALSVDDPAAAKALAAGQAVSFDRRNVKDGKVTIRVVTDLEKADEASTRGEDAPGQDKVFPVYQAPDSVNAWGVRLILPPATAKAAGLATVPFGSYFTLDGKASSEQRQKLEGELDRMGVDASLQIESGYQGDTEMMLLVLTVFAGLVTIGAAGIATGLAQADAEGDLKTLAAVGAAPRVRRTLSGFQCGVVAAMGVVLGSAAGVLPAIGLRLTERREQIGWYEEAITQGFGADGPKPYVPVVVPWETLAALLVVVPLGAALLAALVTRSSGALARRAAG